MAKKLGHNAEKADDDLYDPTAGMALEIEPYQCGPNNLNTDWEAAGLPEGGPVPNMSEKDAGNV
jgi:hypothetical protein